MSITVDFWGDMACFTQPALKVDRVTYPVPTPSGLVGACESIYSKPLEFHWSVRRIELMKEIRYMNCKLNEVTCRMNPNAKEPINVQDFRTQRGNVFLRDVKYRVTADIIPRPGFETKLDHLVAQAERRIRKGQCFKQPYLGTSNCRAYFAPADMSAKPVDVSMDCGIMVFSTHDPHDNSRGGSGCDTSLFHCVVEHGVIEVPDYDSPSVLKLAALTGGGAIC